MSQDLKQTPFHDQHVALGARMVPFVGFSMPIQYAGGMIEEHNAVRNAVGVFDVSHMGEFEVTGPDRNAFVNRITCNDVSALEPGQAQYSALLNEEGTFVDDCLVYRFDDKLMLVVNASNIGKNWNHILKRKGNINIRLKDISEEVALLAVQGPKAQELLQSLTQADLEAIGYYRFDTGEVAGADCFISRTGYTGEDGFELYFRAKHAAQVWAAVAGPGRAVPCGLGARDSLRLEAGLALYGNDIDDGINPYEARLGWMVKLKKGAPFTGKAALEQIKAKGVTRKLVGFVPEGRTIPRPGMDVYLKDRKVDVVRSGGFGATVGHAIGTTYLPSHSVEPGTTFQIDVRGKRVEAKVAKMPFYTDGSVRR